MLITVLTPALAVATSLLAVGDAFANVTVTVAVSVPPLPSETRYVKLSVPLAFAKGVYVAVSDAPVLFV